MLRKLAVVLMMAAAVAVLSIARADAAGAIVVASKIDTEGALLGQMIAALLEARGAGAYVECGRAASQGIPRGRDHREALLLFLSVGRRGGGQAGASARARRPRGPRGRRGLAGAPGRLPLLGRRDHHGAAGSRRVGDRVRQGDT